MNRPENPITYASAGVDYQSMDPLKILAQMKAKETMGMIERHGFFSMESSRGESAYVWDQGKTYGALVIEGLGTKNLVADEMRKITGKTYYDSIAQDTVAMIVNDLVTVGADPAVVNAYFAVGDSNWFKDEERTRDLVTGWAESCKLAGAVWGGGETPTLKGVIEERAIDLSGSAFGIIDPKERYVLRRDKIKEGDAILLVSSNGIHANGLTLARKVAEQLPNGYATKMSNGEMYGEALLRPTHIYANLVRDLFKAHIDIHYMINMTGHGWRKLMRSKQEFKYIIDTVPAPQPEFRLIQKYSRNTNEEMYATFNMGAGFAIYLSQEDVTSAREVAIKNELRAIDAGHIEKGPKQVVIQNRIVFEEDSLQVR